MKDEKSYFYSQGYKTEFLTAIKCMQSQIEKGMPSDQLSKTLVDYYNKTPLVNQITDVEERSK